MCQIHLEYKAEKVWTKYFIQQEYIQVNKNRLGALDKSILL